VWLEYFADGPNASFFAATIEQTKALLVPSLTIYEVFKRVLQQRDEGADAALWTQAADFKSLPSVRYRPRKS